jgi:hypothetical protein
MSTLYVWVVVDKDNQTLVTRAERKEAIRNLQHFRGLGKKCALILETTEGYESRERTMIDFDETCDFPELTTVAS